MKDDVVRVEKLEDLNVWQRSRELVGDVYGMTRREKFKKDFILVDQIRRSAVSVMSNIAEGFERGSTPAFIQFLYIAKGSCGEVRSQLYVASDQNYIDKLELERIKEKARQVSGMIGNLIAYLRRTRLKVVKEEKTTKRVGM